MDGRALRFRLFGINNQNFIMRDDETGSWWQQVTGEAIHGPLKGRRLRPVFHDEISFGVFRQERPMGRVLKPVPESAKEYADWNWEKQHEEGPHGAAERKGRSPRAPSGGRRGEDRRGGARLPLPPPAAAEPDRGPPRGRAHPARGAATTGSPSGSSRARSRDGRSPSPGAWASNPAPLRCGDGQRVGLHGCRGRGIADGPPAREGARPEGVLVRLEDLQRGHRGLRGRVRAAP